jgi:hypothetical protein
MKQEATEKIGTDRYPRVNSHPECVTQTTLLLHISKCRRFIRVIVNLLIPRAKSAFEIASMPGFVVFRIGPERGNAEVPV